MASSAASQALQIPLIVSSMRPAEVFDKILQYADPATISAIMLVNKAWFEAGLRHRWTCQKSHMHSTIEDLITIPSASRQKYARHVVAVLIPHPASGDDGQLFSGLLKGLKELYFPRLRSLDIRRLPQDDMALQLYQLMITPKLRSLTIDSWLPASPKHTASTIALLKLAQAQCKELKCLELIIWIPNGSPAGEWTLEVLCQVIRGFASVEKLYLETDLEFAESFHTKRSFVFPDLFKSVLQLPNLNSLVLRPGMKLQMVTAEDISMELFNLSRLKHFDAQIDAGYLRMIAPYLERIWTLKLEEIDSAVNDSLWDAVVNGGFRELRVLTLQLRAKAIFYCEDVLRAARDLPELQVLTIKRLDDDPPVKDFGDELVECLGGLLPNLRILDLELSWTTYLSAASLIALGKTCPDLHEYRAWGLTINWNDIVRSGITWPELTIIEAYESENQQTGSQDLRDMASRIRTVMPKIKHIDECALGTELYNVLSLPGHDDN